jgi:hypothetical protein
MREIEGIEEAIRVLAPQMPKIQAYFDEENERFKALLAIEHDRIGRVLKCHLVVENFLTRHLKERYDSETIEDAKLSFLQKAQLLPTKGEISTFVRPGILSLNKVRNKLAHDIDVGIEFDDIGPIMEVLSYARPEISFPDPCSAVEAFAAVACAFLIVAPPELQYVMVKAFRSIRHVMR